MKYTSVAQAPQLAIIGALPSKRQIIPRSGGISAAELHAWVRAAERMWEIEPGKNEMSGRGCTPCQPVPSQPDISHNLYSNKANANETQSQNQSVTDRDGIQMGVDAVHPVSELAVGSNLVFAPGSRCTSNRPEELNGTASGRSLQDNPEDGLERSAAPTQNTGSGGVTAAGFHPVMQAPMLEDGNSPNSDSQEPGL